MARDADVEDCPEEIQTGFVLLRQSDEGEPVQWQTCGEQWVDPPLARPGRELLQGRFLTIEPRSGPLVPRREPIRRNGPFHGVSKECTKSDLRSQKGVLGCQEVTMDDIVLPEQRFSVPTDLDGSAQTPPASASGAGTGCITVVLKQAVPESVLETGSKAASGGLRNVNGDEHSSPAVKRRRYLLGDIQKSPFGIRVSPCRPLARREYPGIEGVPPSNEGKMPSIPALPMPSIRHPPPAVSSRCRPFKSLGNLLVAGRYRPMASM